MLAADKLPSICQLSRGREPELEDRGHEPARNRLGRSGSTAESAFEVFRASRVVP